MCCLRSQLQRLFLMLDEEHHVQVTAARGPSAQCGRQPVDVPVQRRYVERASLALAEGADRQAGIGHQDLVLPRGAASDHGPNLPRTASLRDEIASRS